VSILILQERSFVFDLIIAGGMVVAPDGHLDPIDVGVIDGKVVAMERGLRGATRRVDLADGCIVLPGVIDIHTHLRSPQPEAGLFSGETASAVAGGVTMVGDFAYPPGTRFELGYEAKRERLERESLCDFCIHTVVRTPEQAEKAKSRTVKVFFSTSGLGAQAGNAQKSFEIAMHKGHQVLAHIEKMDDYQNVIQHVIRGNSPGRVHILHVPHQRFVSVVRAADSDRISMETCPHYLLWEWTRGREACDVNPAIVPNDLWETVRTGRIDTIGTDHCSYTRQEKQEYGLPGFPGVEESLRLMITCGVQAGRISWADLCRLLSSGPARVLGLYPGKGSLQIGSDADMAVLDLNYEERAGGPASGRGRFSPYTGLWLKSKVMKTFVRGREVYSDGNVDLDAAGWGTLREGVMHG
jgi:dihydroorotase-like cyclic amidohydrolase